MTVKSENSRKKNQWNKKQVIWKDQWNKQASGETDKKEGRHKLSILEMKPRISL